VGSYAIQNQGTVTAGTNYAMTFNSDKTFVTTAASCPSPRSQDKVYGEETRPIDITDPSGALVGGDQTARPLIRVAGEEENCGRVYAINPPPPPGTVTREGEPMTR